MYIGFAAAAAASQLTASSGATVVRASFPAAIAGRMHVTITFDSSGRLVRYSESRGYIPPIHPPPGLPRVQVDSVLRASIEAVRMTNVTLDFPVDRAIAVNRGGGRPSNAITGTVRSIEHLPSLGDPRARLDRVRKLCGV